MNRLALTVCLLLSPTLGDASPIEVLSTNYLTRVSSTVFDGTEARTQQSYRPRQDSIGFGAATASADLFAIDLFTDAKLATPELTSIAMFNHSQAEATSTLTFRPLVSETASLTLAVQALDYAAGFSTGHFTLTDLTANAPLWSYAFGFGADRVPFTMYTSTDWRIAIAAETLLSSDHTYQLAMFGETDSATPDYERVHIRVSGLQAVPEPATLLLLGTVMIGAWVARQRRHLR